MKPDRQEELQESLDFLRGRFEELNRDIKLPHSLDAEVLRARLEEIGEAPEEKSGKVLRWRAAASVAACLVVVLGAVWFLNSGAAKSADLLGGPASTETAPAEAADMAPAPAAAAPSEEAVPMLASAAYGGEEAACYAADYTEIRDTIYRLAGDQMRKGSFGGPADFSMADGAAPEAVVAEDAASAADAGGMIRSAPAAFSGTNVQEDGVDEADIVKTDGKYLYSYVYQNTTSQSPAIFIADAQEMTLTATIKVDPAIDEFYLDGDKLVTVGYSDDELPAPGQTVVEATDDSLIDTSAAASDAALRKRGGWDGGVEMTVYDISNPTEPQEVRSFRQDGSYVSSRMMDGTLYLVSRKYVYADLSDRFTPMSDIVPVCFESGAAEPRLLPADKIAIAPGCSSADYAVVSAVDVRTGRSDTRAVLGGGEGIYMSPDSLYVYYGSWRGTASESESYQRTGIVKFSAGDGGLDLMGTAWVDGYVDGQFAFSELDGNLRVATSAEYPVKGASNNLYVLDGGMRLIGSLEGLAPGERIYSVRYLGEMAYVVTFRETDPLFAIDLSNPRAPKVLGQLKIPGFSEYLHPLGDGLLLGIGQSVDERGTANGVKLSMFDVSDPLAPKELYVYNFGGEGVWAEALFNHKAVLFDEKRSLFGFAVDTGFGRIVSSYYVFSYGRDADSFTLKAKISHDDFGPNAFSGVNRGLYIGDTLYTFSPDWIVSYDLGSFTRKEILPLK